MLSVQTEFRYQIQSPTTVLNILVGLVNEAQHPIRLFIKFGKKKVNHII